MGSEVETTDTNTNSTTTTKTTTTTTIPTLPLFSLLPLKSHQHYSSNLNSPLHTSASVPFSWEEQPGKPLPCLTLALPSNNNKSLELPPRLLNETKFTKTPSPTTVLEGPYIFSSSNVGKSSSFRFLRKRQGSFDGSLNLEDTSPEKGLLGTIVLSRSSSSRRDNHNNHNKGLFGSWRKRGGQNLKSKTEGSFVFPSFLSDDGTSTTTTSSSCDVGGATVKVTKMSKKPNFLGLSSNKSNFWEAIYGAFKQVIPSPRRSTKWKKDAW
ncbi:uncharacterized protein At4g00950 [Beta vulgaris subsp. vulgaris]|uniref:uncharacterized protein At4g00950 n=1 Tax=Beta vulgaris subsp. vulgaris TaxID=3555 RepID=UPI0020371DAD|nr:uncharacterized protein At4g00950 [Beta vulgaris subsp. vulgaris]